MTEQELQDTMSKYEKELLDSIADYERDLLFYQCKIFELKSTIKFLKKVLKDGLKSKSNN